VLNVPVNGIIIQAREKHGPSIYGYFTFASSPLSIAECANREVCIVIM